MTMKNQDFPSVDQSEAVIKHLEDAKNAYQIAVDPFSDAMIQSDFLDVGAKERRRRNGIGYYEKISKESLKDALNHLKEAGFTPKTHSVDELAGYLGASKEGLRETLAITGFFIEPKLVRQYKDALKI